MTISEIIFYNYALKEIQGPEQNTPEIVNFFSEIGHSWVKNDELAWCAAFANAMLKLAGFPHTGKLNARSFLDLGDRIGTPRPLGSSEDFVDMAVLWRVDPNSPYGHIGFFLKERGDLIYLLGGNQSNRVKISAYSRSRLLEYRRIYRIKKTRLP